MLISTDHLADVIEVDQLGEQHLPEIHVKVWKLTGRKADVIYIDGGNGWSDIVHISPKTESIEALIKAIIEGGSPGSES